MTDFLIRFTVQLCFQHPDFLYFMVDTVMLIICECALYLSVIFFSWHLYYLCHTVSINQSVLFQNIIIWLLDIFVSFCWINVTLYFGSSLCMRVLSISTCINLSVLFVCLFCFLILLVYTSSARFDYYCRDIRPCYIRVVWVQLYTSRGGRLGLSQNFHRTPDQHL